MSLSKSHTPHQVQSSKSSQFNQAPSWWQAGPDVAAVCQSPQPAFFCVRHCAEWPQVLWTILRLEPAVLPYALSLLFPRLFSLPVGWMSKHFFPFKLGTLSTTNLSAELQKFLLKLQVSLSWVNCWLLLYVNITVEWLRTLSLRACCAPENAHYESSNSAFLVTWCWVFLLMQFSNSCDLILPNAESIGQKSLHQWCSTFSERKDNPQHSPNNEMDV